MSENPFMPELSLKNVESKSSEENVEMSLNDVVINLRLIAKIEVGEKLTINGKYFNIDNNYFNFFTRWLYGVDRKSNLNLINIILSKAFYYSENCDNVNDICRLIKDLNNSINGLNNLKQTYYSDKLVQSHIDLMIDNIRVNIENSSNKLNLKKSEKFMF